MSEVVELIELPAPDTCLQVFTNQSMLDEILDTVRQRVIGTVYDMSKRKDREACASDAYKVARTKAAMEKLRAEPTKGPYEVLRMRHSGCEDPMIVHGRDSGDHFTTWGESARMVRQYIRSKRKL